MSVKAYSREQIEEMSMIEIAYEFLKEEKTTFTYLDLLKQVADLKGLTEDQVKEKIGYLYTNLNVDGRFVCLGDNVWGLKTWYPIEKLEEDIITQKPKKKVKDLEDDADLNLDDDFEDYDDENEFDELEDELDEIAGEDDHDEFEDEDLDGFDDEDGEAEEEDDLEVAEEDEEEF